MEVVNDAVVEQTVPNNHSLNPKRNHFKVHFCFLHAWSKGIRVNGLTDYRIPGLCLVPNKKIRN